MFFWHSVWHSHSVSALPLSMSLIRQGLYLSQGPELAATRWREYVSPRGACRREGEPTGCLWKERSNVRFESGSFGWSIRWHASRCWTKTTPTFLPT
jgi:hypothetical protein